MTDAPAPTPLDLLEVIRARWRSGYPQTTRIDDAFVPARDDVGWLLAEVERLRAALAAREAWQPEYCTVCGHICLTNKQHG